MEHEREKFKRFVSAFPLIPFLPEYNFIVSIYKIDRFKTHILKWHVNPEKIYYEIYWKLAPWECNLSLFYIGPASTHFNHSDHLLSKSETDSRVVRMKSCSVALLAKLCIHGWAPPSTKGPMSTVYDWRTLRSFTQFIAIR